MKLICHLGPRKDYVVQYALLKYYIYLGVVITKTTKVIEFKQSKWLKPYMEFNIEKRKTSDNDFHRDLFKLMHNSYFGKCFEDKFIWIDFELVNRVKRHRKLAAKPSYKQSTIFDEGLVGVHKRKTKIILVKPIFVGFAVLEYSKLNVFRFGYVYLIPRFRPSNTQPSSKITLLACNTDIYFVVIENGFDVYQELSEDGEYFDFSNYPEEVIRKTLFNESKESLDV